MARRTPASGEAPLGPSPSPGMSAHAANMVGTPSSVVTPSSRTWSSDCGGVETGCRARAPLPWPATSPSATLSPKTWNSGSATRPMSSARRISGMPSIWRRLAIRLPWVSMAALGSPAVPDVNSNTARSASSRSTGCSSACSAQLAVVPAASGLDGCSPACGPQPAGAAPPEALAGRHGRALPQALPGDPAGARPARRGGRPAAGGRRRPWAMTAAGSTTSSSRPSSAGGLLGLRGTATAPAASTPR